MPPLPLLLGYALADDGELFVKERKERVRRRVKVIDAVLGTVAFSGEPPPLSLELLLPKYLKLRHWSGLPSEISQPALSSAQRFFSGAAYRYR